MPKLLKGIAVGSAVTIAGGIIGYFIVIFWLIAQGISDSAELVDTIRSNKAMYWSIPYTLTCMVIAIYLSSKKLLSGHYLVAMGVSVLVSLSIHFGPLKIVTIHMSHLTIFVGALTGAFLASKLNKPLKNDDDKAGAL